MSDDNNDNNTPEIREYVLRPKKIEWYTDLLDLIDDKYMTQFEYGQHDCALWGADALQIQLEDGFDIAARWRGKYTTLAQGMRAIKASGFASYVDVFAQVLPELPSPRLAQSGDLIVLKGLQDMDSIGVVVKNIIYAPTERSLGILPFTAGLRAFAVGRLPDDDT